MYVVICCMQWMGLLAVGVVTYVMTFHSPSSHRKGSYLAPNWNFAVKQLWAERQLRKKNKDEKQKALDFQNFKSEQTSDYDNFNSTLIYGNDTEGNSLFIKMTRGSDMTTDFVLVLEINKDVWTLPETFNSTIVPYNRNASEKFELNGLTIECIRPFRKWRITFAGYLVKNNSQQVQQFVKFNFFWTTCGPPQHWPSDWSPKLKAVALAAEPWRHGYWLDYLAISDYGGFDQFGSMYGQLHLTDIDGLSQKPIELNLPGVRQRRQTSYDVEKIHRSASVIGISPDGSVYLLESFSLDKNLTSAQYGYVRKSNGDIFPIDWTDFHLAKIPENHENVPKAISISFSANGQVFSTSVYVTNCSVSYVGMVPRRFETDLIRAQIGINGTNGQGVVILSLAKRSNSIVASPKSAIPLLKYSDHKPTKTKIAYWFSDASAQSEQISGGKGASLALLMAATKLNFGEANLNYTVPNGFVLSVSAFDLQMNAHPTIVKLIDTIRDIAYQRIEGDLEKACTAAVQAISECPLELEVQQIVGKFYRDLQSQTESPLRLAVRSSAVGEDSDDSSAAGQNETFLGLSSIDGVIKAVQNCWASIYSIRSVEYRRQHLQPINAQMAVVLQTMVDSDCAGVIFTCDPSTGDPKKVLITANYGLGESVVSGAVDPDTFVLKREKNNTLSLHETHVGIKVHSIKMSANEISQSDLDKDEQAKLCLTEEQAMRLAQIAVGLERIYGSARDIEWAVHKNHVYLLQSRPITTLNYFSNWELLHEMDSAIMSKNDLNTFANLGEVFPECTTPLTLSTIIWVLEKCMAGSVRGEKPIYGGIFASYIPVSHYRAMMDVYSTMLLVREKEISINDKLLGVSVCGHEFVTPEIHRISIERHGIASGLKKLLMMKQILVYMWTNKAAIESLKRKMEKVLNRFSKENLINFKDHDAKMFNDEINLEIEDPNRLELSAFVHTKTSQVSSFSQVIAMTMLAEGSADVSPDHCIDIGALLSSCNEIESAEVPDMLDQICNVIYLSGLLNEFVSLQPNEGEEWLIQKCPKASNLFKHFVTRHAHRAIKEFDFKSITWGMNPSMVINMLQSTCSHLNTVITARPKRIEHTDEQIIKELRSPKKSFTRKLLSYILPLCKTSVRHRETTKSCLISYIHELRKAYIHLAELLVNEGLLPDRNLIFYFDREDLELLIDKPDVGKSLVNKGNLVAKAQRRMRLFPQWNEYRFEEFNIGLVKPMKVDDCDLTGVELVQGTSVTEGLVTGRACVITSVADVYQIRSGDILVTVGTDIGWSTYFPILGGVVTELGGLISHGAVVAREYGIPCIVGAVGATRTIRNDDTVTLNATDGIIFKTKEDASEA